MVIKPFVIGLSTFIPGLPGIIQSRKTGGTDSADYCYGVWLKHLTHLWENGMRAIPETIAEVGPGDSLGTGLAAILCGVNHYYALDVVKHSDIRTNLNIFEELVTMLRARAGRPTSGWPQFDAYLDKNLFPSHILTAERLGRTLSDLRIAAIRKAIANPGRSSGAVTIEYIVPWRGSKAIEENSLDLIISHTVLQHIADIEGAYQAFQHWLKPEGLMSHQIDFTSMGLSEYWNGHWSYSEPIWKLVNGKRNHLINRLPHSGHLDLLEKNHFDVLMDLKCHRWDGIRRRDLSERWKGIADEDLNCCAAFIQASKR